MWDWCVNVIQLVRHNTFPALKAFTAEYWFTFYSTKNKIVLRYWESNQTSKMEILDVWLGSERVSD